MKITFDKQADAGYIEISNKKVHKTIIVNDYCNIDIDEENAIVGIELLFISQYSSDFKFWLDLANAAEYLNKSIPTIRRWVQEGKIPYYKPGKEYMFTKEDLDKFIQEHRQP